MDNKVNVSSKNMVTCPACHSCFKLQDHIPIRQNRVSCVKCNKAIMLVFANRTSEKFENNPDDMKGIEYDYIERYYKPKNDSLKNVIKEICNTSFIRPKLSDSELNEPF